MRKIPPLPFQGNKAKINKYLIPIINKIPNNSTVVDLFGGSLYLSYLIKYIKPTCRVICNDFDNYRERLNHITEINHIITDLNKLIDLTKYKYGDKLTNEDTKIIQQYLKDYDGYIDYQTLASRFMFSGSNSNRLLSNVNYYYRNNNYINEDIDDYTNNIEYRKCDWKDLYNEFKNEDVIFITDPPYLYTDKGNYKNTYWKLKDSLETINIIIQHKFIFFSSPKSGTMELLNFMSNYIDLPNYEYQQINKARINNFNKSNEDIIIYRF